MREHPIRWYSGVPPVEAFSTVDGKGTPIVIDTTANAAYYLAPDNTVQLLSSGGSGSTGFNDGKWNRYDLAGTWTISVSGKSIQWNPGPGFSLAFADQGRAEGKRYFEILISAIYSGYPTSVHQDIGIAPCFAQPPLQSLPQDFAAYRASGAFVFGGVITTGKPKLSASDVVGVAVNFANGKVWFRRNGTWLVGDPATDTGAPGTVPNGRLYYPALDVESGGLSAMNTTLRVIEADFTGSLPSGFKAWGAY